MIKKLIGRILKWILWILLILIAGAVAFIAISRFIVWRETRMTGENSVDERIYVPLGGQDQFISIRGEDQSNPVVIFLHGGPASPNSYVDHKWQSRIADGYTFISWTQRGSGRTYYENKKKDPENDTVTREQLLSDLDELVDYARERFSQDKVIIMGHSWGTILGTDYSIMHPEKVRMFVSVSQAVSAKAGEELSYREARSRALARLSEVREMDEAWMNWLSEDNSFESLLRLRMNTQPYLKAHNASSALRTVLMGLTSPYMGMRDIRWFLSEMDAERFYERNRKLFDEIRDFDLRKEVPSIPVPVIFITGEDDWITPIELTREWRNMIDAPYSVMTFVNGCGHMVMFDDPENFAALFDRTVSSIEAKLSRKKAIPLIPRKNMSM